jgi:phosphate starvation-inducible PhoH-like protein
VKKIALPQEGIEILYGAHDGNLKHIESLLGVAIRTQGDELIVEGEKSAEQRVERIFDQLKTLMAEGYELRNGDVKTAAQLIVDDGGIDLRDYFLKGGQKQPEGTKRRVNPKSTNQRRYLDAIEKYDIVFGVGPAGTGKT